MDLRKLKKLIDLVEAWLRLRCKRFMRLPRLFRLPLWLLRLRHRLPPPRLHPPLRRAICPTRKNRPWWAHSIALPALLRLRLWKWGKR